MRPAQNSEKLGYNKDNPVYVDIKESWWTIGSMITALLALAASIWALYIAWSPRGLL